MICKNCGKDANYIKTRFINKELVEQCNHCSDLSLGSMTRYGGGVTAIYTDSKGNLYPVNSNGNIVSKNPYENDSRGWKHSGKKNPRYMV